MSVALPKYVGNESLLRYSSTKSIKQNTWACSGSQVWLQQTKADFFYPVACLDRFSPLLDLTAAGLFCSTARAAIKSTKSLETQHTWVLGYLLHKAQRDGSSACWGLQQIKIVVWMLQMFTNVFLRKSCIASRNKTCLKSRITHLL